MFSLISMGKQVYRELDFSSLWPFNLEKSSPTPDIQSIQFKFVDFKMFQMAYCGKLDYKFPDPKCNGIDWIILKKKKKKKKLPNNSKSDFKIVVFNTWFSLTVCFSN